MNFFQNIASDKNSDATYLIAQYNREPFRHEPKNVGVIVEKRGVIACKFKAEREPGNYSSSQLRSFQNPNAYRLWVDAWRKSLSKRSKETPINDTLKSGVNYSIVDGGSLANSGVDTARQVCEYLYSLLVSDGGLSEALGETNELDESAILLNAVKKEFSNAGISGPNSTARNPIRTNQAIVGASHYYTFPFYQKYQDDIWLMTAINFSGSRNTRSRDYAAYMSCALNDITSSNKTKFKYYPTAIVRFGENDDEATAAGINFLNTSRFNLIDWSNDDERKSFISEREQIAFAV